MTHLMISTYSNVFRILNILRALSDLQVYIEFAHSYIHRKKCQESLKSLVRKNQAVQCTATSMRRGGEVEILTGGDSTNSDLSSPSLLVASRSLYTHPPNPSFGISLNRLRIVCSPFL